MKTASFFAAAAAVSLAWAAVAGADEPRIEPSVIYGHKYGLAMTMDVYQPAGDSNGAGVLFIVSGGWYSQWMPPEQLLPLFQELLDAGYAVFAVRHGSSPKFTIPEAVSDVRRSVRFIRANAPRFAIDADRLGVFGISAGGHLSLMLGTTADDGQADAADPVERQSNRVAAVAAWVAPTDLTIMVWEAPERLAAYENFPALDLSLEEAPRYSPLHQVNSGDAPSLLIVGDQDELVPMNHSARIHEAFQEQEVASELLVIEGAGHGFAPPDQQRAIRTMLDWFDRHLR